MQRFCLVMAVTLLCATIAGTARGGLPKLPDNSVSSMCENVYGKIGQDKSKVVGLLYYDDSQKLGLKETKGVYRHGVDEKIWVFTVFSGLDPVGKYQVQYDTYDPSGKFTGSESLVFVPQSKKYKTWLWRDLVSDKYGVLAAGGWTVKIYLNGYLLLTVGFQIKKEKPEQIDSFEEVFAVAQEGNAQAQVRLGFMLHEGIAVRKNDKEAFKWFFLAAINGLDRAQYNLGLMYVEGSGCERDTRKALYWWEKAASQGFVEADNELGNFYYRQNDYSKALRYFKRAAENKHPDAMYNLGVAYQKGLGVAKDPEMALLWYMKAIRAGNHNACNNLANMYLHGEGVEKDEELAFSWWLRAAEKGNPEAAANLGITYHNRKKNKENVVKAMYWLSRAAEHGVAESQYNLAFSCDKEFTVPEMEKSIYWCKKAANQGNVDAQVYLGIKYVNQEGGYKRAFYWLKKAADQGNISAQNLVGLMYLEGQGVEKNVDKAATYLKKAAAGGMKDASKALERIQSVGL